MRRYQIYLNPHSVNIIDELAEMSKLTRSQLLREAVDAVASRFSNLLAVFKPPKARNYSWLDKMTGSIKIKGGETVNISENVDELYYR